MGTTSTSTSTSDELDKYNFFQNNNNYNNLDDDLLSMGASSSNDEENEDFLEDDSIAFSFARSFYQHFRLLARNYTEQNNRQNLNTPKALRRSNRLRHSTDTTERFTEAEVRGVYRTYLKGRLEKGF